MFAHDEMTGELSGFSMNQTLEPHNINGQTLYHGDCFEAMALIPDGSVDMILCDLPYGTTACKWDQVIPFEPLWAAYKRVIKPNGVIVLTASQPFTSDLIASNRKDFRYCWVWEKNKPTGFMNVKKLPLRAHEDICVFGGNTYNPQGTRECHIVKSNNKVGRGSVIHKWACAEYYVQSVENYPRSVLRFDSECNGLHPTQKPVPLFEYLIRTYTNSGDAVLDNCAGSMTTAIACINSDRHSICIERDDEYFAKGMARVTNHVKADPNAPVKTKAKPMSVRPEQLGLLLDVA